MIALLMGKLKGWLALLGATLLVLIGAYTAGGRATKRNIQAQQQRDRENALRDVNATDEKLAQMDDDSVRGELAKWVRAADK